MTVACPFKALLFDVDGTLIDSNSAHAESWTESLHDNGIEVDVKSVRRLIGMGSDKLLPILAGVESGSSRGRAIDRRRKALFAERLLSLQPTRGARDLLLQLRESRVALVIATSADENEMKALLEQAGIDDVIPTRTSRDDAPSSKPNPDIVKAALRRAGEREADTAMIGDTPYDIEAASRAGLRTIALRCGGYWPDEDLSRATAIFDDPAALLARWTRG